MRDNTEIIAVQIQYIIQIYNYTLAITSVTFKDIYKYMYAS